MALVVEDGSGVTGAESYFATATADAYWLARPQDARAGAWAAAATADKEGAAREASAYLDATWGSLYIGVRKTAGQGLLWPRIDRTALSLNDCIETVEELEAEQADTDKPLIGADGLELAGLPAPIVSAAIELAARALSARLAPDIDPAEQVLIEEKIGPLQFKYGTGPAIPGGSFGFVDTLLAPVLIGQRNAIWNWA